MIIYENGIETDTIKNNTLEIKTDSSSGLQVNFLGRNNILIVEEGVRFEDSIISFSSDNALVYLSRSNKPYKLKISACRSSVIYFGSNNYFNSQLNAIVSEQQNLIIGGDGVFSFDIWIRTADPHLIYDIDSHKRINNSKSILIGDHVWLGQSAMILKGTSIGSGSIVGAGAVLAGKTIRSNEVWGGNPGRKLKENVFFLGNCVHDYTKEQIEKSQFYGNDCYTFEEDEKTIETNAVFAKLTEKEQSVDKLQILENMVIKNRNSKNRFSINFEMSKTSS